MTLGAQNILLALIVAPTYWIYYAFVIRAGGGPRRGVPGGLRGLSRGGSPDPAAAPASRRGSDISPRDARALLRAVLDAQVFMWLLVFLEILEYTQTTRLGGFFRPIWILPF